MRFSPTCLAIVFIASLCPYAQAQDTETKNPQVNEVKGMPARSSPGDYQAQAKAGTVTVAAEFLGHSIPRPEGPLSTEDYVVVETGLFGSPGQRLTLSPDNFTLHINGKKTPLASQPFVLVVKSVKDPEWAPPDAAKSKSKSSFGTGGQADANSPPPVVHVPIELQRAMAQHVQKVSLPEGDRALPEAGLIFFQYRGKAQSIHSIELIYSGPAGQATLALQP